MTNETRIAELYADRATKRDECIADAADLLVSKRGDSRILRECLAGLCDALDARDAAPSEDSVARVAEAEGSVESAWVDYQNA